MNEIELTTLNLTPDERIALSCALDICLESMKGSLHNWQDRESQLNPDENTYVPECHW